MKHLKIITLLLTLLVTTLSFSQTKDYFKDGFNAGYTNTCKKYGDGRCNFGDPNQCKVVPRNSTYEKNVNQKLYQDGYECGVMQAMEYVNHLKSQTSNSSTNNVGNAEEIKKASDIAMQKEIDRVNKANAEQIKKIKYNDNKHSRTTINSISLQQKTSQKRRESAVNKSAERFSSTLGNLNSIMQQQARANFQVETNRRSRVANNFINDNSQKIARIKELYSKIPKSKFSKKLTGLYRGNVIVTKEYTLLHNQESSNVIDCYVSVISGIVVDVYLFGKKEITLDAPNQQPENSKLSNGIVKYTNYNTFEETTVVLLEPYLKNGDSSLGVIESGNNISWV